MRLPTFSSALTVMPGNRRIPAKVELVAIRCQGDTRLVVGQRVRALAYCGSGTKASRLTTEILPLDVPNFWNG